jgi:hypothetical protein
MMELLLLVPHISLLVVVVVLTLDMVVQVEEVVF